MSEPKEKAAEIHRLLIGEYGDRSWEPRADPLSELVGTVLSQNTSDLNSGRAFDALRAVLPTWEAVRDAPAELVEQAIRCGGLSAIKAPRIQRILAEITRQRGGLDLCFLDAMPVGEARRWLVALEGVGVKTAACVLMFALGKPVIPVDTHVHRLSRRLGLAGAKDSPERTEAILESLVPPEHRYAFHINLIAHGRRVCKAQRPLCDRCVLTSLCAYYAEQTGAGVAAAASAGTADRG